MLCFDFVVVVVVVLAVKKKIGKLNLLTVYNFLLRAMFEIFVLITIGTGTHVDHQLSFKVNQGSKSVGYE